jgi:hypothetical protein
MQSNLKNNVERATNEVAQRISAEWSHRADELVAEMSREVIKHKVASQEAEEKLLDERRKTDKWEREVNEERSQLIDTIESLRKRLGELQFTQSIQFQPQAASSLVYSSPPPSQKNHVIAEGEDLILNGLEQHLEGLRKQFSGMLEDALQPSTRVAEKPLTHDIKEEEDYVNSKDQELLKALKASFRRERNLELLSPETERFFNISAKYRKV